MCVLYVCSLTSLRVARWEDHAALLWTLIIEASPDAVHIRTMLMYVMDQASYLLAQELYFTTFETELPESIDAVYRWFTIRYLVTTSLQGRVYCCFATRRCIFAPPAICEGMLRPPLSAVVQ